MNKTWDTVPAALVSLPGPLAEPIPSAPHSQDGVSTPAHLRDLNLAQRTAAEYGVSDTDGAQISGPLLVIAGAGTGKTNTLAHRVAHLIVTGTLPERILLLTFTRRAAEEMIRRAQRILAAAWAKSRPKASGAAGEIAWSGTFHAIGNRLLREHAERVGLDPSFTVLDRTDSEDRLNLVRNDLGLAKKGARFPRKATSPFIRAR
jgi:DNA helicase-2/ATP-dependent DNA helicase PcrA